MTSKNHGSFVPKSWKELPAIQRTSQEEKNLKATMIFMRKFASKITLFLSLSDGWEINNSMDELTERDLDEIDAFFKEVPNASIGYDSEIENQRIMISLDTLLALKEKVILRIFWKFLDMFEDFPSRYALEWAIHCAKKYKNLNWITIFSDDAIVDKRKILLKSEIRWQKDAIQDWIYNDNDTIKGKKSRIEGLEEELRNLKT